MLHFHLHDRGAVPSLKETREEAIFGYTLYCPNIPGTDHIYDAALLIARNLLTELSGKGWKLTEEPVGRESAAHPAETAPHPTPIMAYSIDKPRTSSLAAQSNGYRPCRTQRWKLEYGQADTR
jgi:hypothetical protein